MPATSRIDMSSDASISQRTILFPAAPVAASATKDEPKTGTSARRQWLVQLRGPLGPRRRTLEFPPTLAQVTLGSAPSCLCRVDDPGVSRFHAALVRRAHRGVYLVDLSGVGNTHLNGEPVADEVLLMDGDRIALGSGVEFEFLDGPRRPSSRIRRWAAKLLFARDAAEAGA
jgi:FHA domain